MYYIIDYNRLTKHLEITPHENQEFAISDKIKKELDNLKNEINNEVVLLEAKDEETLKVSHTRYFKEAKEIKFVQNKRNEKPDPKPLP